MSLPADRMADNLTEAFEMVGLSAEHAEAAMRDMGERLREAMKEDPELWLAMQMWDPQASPSPPAVPEAPAPRGQGMSLPELEQLILAQRIDGGTFAVSRHEAIVLGHWYLRSALADWAHYRKRLRECVHIDQWEWLHERIYKAYEEVIAWRTYTARLERRFR